GFTAHHVGALTHHPPPFLASPRRRHRQAEGVARIEKEARRAPVDLAPEERPSVRPGEGEFYLLARPIAVKAGPLLTGERRAGAVPVDEPGGEVARPPHDPYRHDHQCGEHHPRGTSPQAVPSSPGCLEFGSPQAEWRSLGFMTACLGQARAIHPSTSWR